MSDFEQEEYYVHRKGSFVGNAPMFWAKGGNGYTSYIQGAERFSGNDANKLHKEDPSKWKLYKCSEVDSRLHLVYDVQDDKQLGTDSPCGWPWGYAAIASMHGEAKFNATADADRLRSVARGMSYNDISEATWKHVILEIAMRLDTGGYNPPVSATKIAEQDARIKELEQQLEVARKDAERYRFVRMPPVGKMNVISWDSRIGKYNDCVGHALDQAIDAAIRQIGGAE